MHCKEQTRWCWPADPHCGLYSMMALSIGSDSVFTVLPDFNFFGIKSPKVITISENA